MKFALRLTSYLVVLAIGLVGGYQLGTGVRHGQGMAFDMIETAPYSAYMQMQMAEGTDAAQEEAIRTYLALIERRRERRAPEDSVSMLAIDAALANARLAALAAKRGAQQEANDYLARAVSYCPQMGWRDCSSEKIVAMADRASRAGIFGLKSSESKRE